MNYVLCTLLSYVHTRQNVPELYSRAALGFLLSVRRRLRLEYIYNNNVIAKDVAFAGLRFLDNRPTDLNRGVFIQSLLLLPLPLLLLHRIFYSIQNFILCCLKHSVRPSVRLSVCLSVQLCCCCFCRSGFISRIRRAGLSYFCIYT